MASAPTISPAATSPISPARAAMISPAPESAISPVPVPAISPALAPALSSAPESAISPVSAATISPAPAPTSGQAPIEGAIDSFGEPPGERSASAGRIAESPAETRKAVRRSELRSGLRSATEGSGGALGPEVPERREPRRSERPSWRSLPTESSSGNEAAGETPQAIADAGGSAPPQHFGREPEGGRFGEEPPCRPVPPIAEKAAFPSSAELFVRPAPAEEPAVAIVPADAPWSEASPFALAVGGAGLVLLHPFLPKLFSATGLSAPDGFSLAPADDAADAQILARTGFGDLFVWDGELFWFAMVHESIVMGSVDDADWFFSRTLLAKDFAPQTYLPQRLAAARQAAGGLEWNEMYTYVPALALGGSPTTSRIERVQALEALALLAGLAPIQRRN
ncbi:MAG TPA: contractile injection system tape measure protein [Thermoanaerobaculia bacterium]|nr:contractile injection system tape measure protein [Thermoanaerobaculia bacterium]